MFNTAEIKKYMYALKNDFGWHIIVGDPYEILLKNGFSDCEFINAWHLNEYCLKIKKTPQLHKRCIYLRSTAYRTKLLKANAPCEVTCYCGVREYTAPVIIDGKLLCTVSAAEYKGEVSEKTINILAKKTGTDRESLSSLYENSLLDNFSKEKERLSVYLPILSDMIKNYILILPENAYSTKNNSGAGQEYVLQALDFIEKHALEPITVNDVAKHCFVSPYYLQHIFSKVLHCGVAEEIKKAKLKTAAELLCTTDRQVKNIAYFCGFDNADYFSTVFLKQYGETPLKYRKKSRNKIKL